MISLKVCMKNFYWPQQYPIRRAIKIRTATKLLTATTNYSTTKQLQISWVVTSSELKFWNLDPKKIPVFEIHFRKARRTMAGLGPFGVFFCVCSVYTRYVFGLQNLIRYIRFFWFGNMVLVLLNWLRFSHNSQFAK